MILPPNIDNSDDTKEPRTDLKTVGFLTHFAQSNLKTVKRYDHIRSHSLGWDGT